MIALTKTMIALSAVMSAGLVTAYDTADSRQQPTAPAVEIAKRFPTANEMLVPGAQAILGQAMKTGKGDRIAAAPAADGCTGQQWPYIATECLASKGANVREPSRTITIERRIGDNTSELVRISNTKVAGH